MKTTLEELGVIRFCSGCNSSEQRQAYYREQGKVCCPDSDQKYVIAKEVESILSEGKLVKPMSAVEILNVLLNIHGKEVKIEDVAEKIYTAQFERTEK